MGQVRAHLATLKCVKCTCIGSARLSPDQHHHTVGKPYAQNTRSSQCGGSIAGTVQLPYSPGGQEGA